MREFARRQTSILLRRFAIQVNRAARGADPEAVHDLRVSIRRLSRCLRVFAQFYPGNGWKKLRRRLKKLMDVCGSVRDRDIALALLSRAGFPATSIVVRRLNSDRRDAIVGLAEQLRPWREHGASRKWRARLGL